MLPTGLGTDLLLFRGAIIRYLKIVVLTDVKLPPDKGGDDLRLDGVLYAPDVLHLVDHLGHGLELIPQVQPLLDILDMGVDRKPYEVDELL